MRSYRRAFALPELAAIIAVVLIAAAILAVAADRTRRTAGLNQSLANLRQIAAWTGSYAADNADRYWGFSWQPSDTNMSTYPDLRGPFGSPIAALAAQATDNLRRRAQGENFPLNFGWVPTIRYSHLVLAEYAGESLPALTFVSPGDRQRIRWARDPAGYAADQYPPQPDPAGGFDNLAYSSSYEVMPAFFQADYNGVESQAALSQASEHGTFFTNQFATFRLRRTAEVAFPSQKVHLAEWMQSFYGSQDIYYLFDEARVPLLLADGSAKVRATSEANRGFDPFQPTRNFPMTFTYSPRPWDPAIPAGASNRVTGNYRWTRLGLRGRDFDGPEIFP